MKTYTIGVILAFGVYHIIYHVLKGIVDLVKK